LGSVDYRGRFQYSASGTVVNLAARLCARAADGQILTDGRVQLAVESVVGAEPLGNLELKGFHRAIRVFNVCELLA
jgi:class 3 adenylate cyclase